MTSDIGAVALAPARIAMVPARKIYAICLILLVFWPLRLLDPVTNIAFLSAVSGVIILASPLRIPRIPAPLLWFGLIYLVVLISSALMRPVGPYFISQANHFAQFIIYYYAFSKAAQGCDWKAILARPAFLTAAGALSIAYFLIDYAVSGEFRYNEIDTTLLAFLAGLFVRGEQRARPLEFAIIVLIAVALILPATRASIVLLMMVIPLLYWIRLPTRLLQVGSLVMVLPLVAYLMLDLGTLRWLYLLDHNAGIRAEFVRSGFSLLQQTPVFGVGFGVPYRPIDFNYLMPHPMLTDLVEINIVPNHHSIFDVALRLGIPAAVLFWWGLFMGRWRAPAIRLDALFFVVLATDLSFNAWFENQVQLPELALIVALLHSDRFVGAGRRGATVSPRAA